MNTFALVQSHAVALIVTIVKSIPLQVQIQVWNYLYQILPHPCLHFQQKLLHRRHLNQKQR